jgi:hypothetical protein
MSTVLEQRLSRSTDAERHLTSFMKYTSKQQLTSWSQGVEDDEKKLKLRQDFIHFPGKHEVLFRALLQYPYIKSQQGIKTTIFVPPESGWVHGVAEKQKQREKT